MNKSISYLANPRIFINYTRSREGGGGCNGSQDTLIGFKENIFDNIINVIGT
jgi:hypothetical protein